MNSVIALFHVNVHVSVIFTGASSPNLLLSGLRSCSEIGLEGGKVTNKLYTSFR